MHPVHDIDVVLLMATALAGKRRPAELVELIAASELLAGAIPSAAALADALQRLSACGLICAVDDAYTLSPAAQKVVSGTRRKADPPERMLDIKEQLAAFEATGVFAAIALDSAQIGAAILAHRAAVKAPGKNLLLPRPQAADAGPRPGQRQRKPLPSHRRKA